MDKVFSKFSIYDHLGYLLVGGIAVLVAIGDAKLLNYAIPVLTAANAAVWLLIAYFLGHLTQATANYFIHEKKQEFTAEEKSILKDVEKYLGLKDQADEQLFALCYMLTIAKNITSHVEVFNAQYSLYRGWTTIFILESVVLLLFAAFNSCSIAYWLAFITSILVSTLFYNRTGRFNKYFRNKVFQSFTIIRSLKI